MKAGSKQKQFLAWLELIGFWDNAGHQSTQQQQQKLQPRVLPRETGGLGVARSGGTGVVVDLSRDGPGK